MAKTVGLAMVLFGWTPGEAWAATPQDLLLGLDARLFCRRILAPPGLNRTEYETLKARLDRA